MWIMARKVLHPTIRRLLDLRTRLKQSQPAFAKSLGISVSTLRSWERGRNNPDQVTLAFILKYLESQKA